MSLLGYFVVVNKTLKSQIRLFSIKKGKHESDEKIEELAEFDLEWMNENDFQVKVDAVVEQFPLLSVNPHYRRSISTLYDHPTEIHDLLFYLKVKARGKTILPMYSRESFWLLAVRSEERVMAFQGEKEFAVIAKHLTDKEGIKMENIVYNPVQFDSDTVSYSYDQIVASVETISLLDNQKDSYKLTQSVNRFFGLGCCFILRDWSWFFFLIFKKKNSRQKLPTSRMSAVRESWTGISQYVLTGGKKTVDVKGVKITLETVKKILYVAHSRVGSPEEKRMEKMPTKVLWNNPKPGIIVPFTRSRFSTLTVPCSRSAGPVLILPGSGGPLFCGSKAGPLRIRPLLRIVPLLSCAKRVLKLISCN